MYWIYRSRIFTWRNKSLQAKLIEPDPKLLHKKYKSYGFHSPKQDKTYGSDFRLIYQIDTSYPCPDNYFDSYGFDLYSERLVALMKYFGVKSEDFPVYFIDREGRLLSDYNYSVFHSLEGQLNAMDEIESGWVGSRDIGIKSLVLDYSKFPLRPIFVCDLIYVSLMRDDLKQAIQEQGITGFSFLNPEKYRSGRHGLVVEFED